MVVVGEGNKELRVKFPHACIVGMKPACVIELTSALLSFPLNRTERMIEADPKTLQN